MFLISNNSLGQAVSRGLVWYFRPSAWITLMLFVLGNTANLPAEYLESSRGSCWSIFFNKFDHKRWMPSTWFPFPCWTGWKQEVEDSRKSKKIFILTVRLSNFEWAKRSNINSIFCCCWMLSKNSFPAYSSFLERDARRWSTFRNKKNFA